MKTIISALIICFLFLVTISNHARCEEDMTWKNCPGPGCPADSAIPSKTTKTKPNNKSSSKSDNDFWKNCPGPGCPADNAIPPSKTTKAKTKPNSKSSSKSDNDFWKNCPGPGCPADNAIINNIGDDEETDDKPSATSAE